MSSQEIRPEDPLLRFFQDCLMIEPERPEADRQTLVQWVAERAHEHEIDEAALPVVLKIAGYIRTTPIAFVEVRRTVGFDLAENTARTRVATFMVPAYGGYTDVISRNLLADGYRRERAAEQREEEICFFNPETRILVSIRLAGLYPVAQGPSGFINTVKSFGELLARNPGTSGSGDGAPGGEADPA